jgi:uncharacterized protein with HEPN domain
MNKRDKTLIEKMVKYIGKVQSYSEGMEYGDFAEDTKTTEACAFAITQISEFAFRLSEKLRTEQSHIPWQSIKGMRNLLVHDYDNVDLTIFWNAIGEKLPELKRDLEAILKTLE